MTIKYNGRNLIKRIIDGREVEKVMYNGVQIRPDAVPPIPNYLCFTGTLGSSIKLKKVGSITSLDDKLEVSYDGLTWHDYTINDLITYEHDDDKVYFRNKSETVINLYQSSSNRYTFETSGSIRASGDIGYLICKNSTDVAPNSCYMYLFYNSTGLVTPPDLPATNLYFSCYDSMFYGCTSLITTPAFPNAYMQSGGRAQQFSGMFRGCTNLETLPALPSTALSTYCYSEMFYGCSKIKLSTTKHDEYQYEYRIPVAGTGTGHSSSLEYMFTNTGGEFTGTPTINTTYYTSNQII